ncbi:MAG: A24 family peptidase [Microlunatus sp.]|nr:A24 family peptidase [Microlunatus sp.]MDN5770311.1 A24 family peptidase [Microlunatus sp.]MDN5803271.1 A24 family peptidase [Microlunatus sp.]
MSTLIVGVAAGAALGLLTGTLTGPTLRWLPEPPEPAEGKIAYADLATARFRGSVGTVSGLAVTLGTVLLPLAVLPLWFVLGTFAVLLAAIDARTTWLPLPLTRLAWAATGVAAVVAATFGGWAQLARSVGGFVAAAAVFGLVWLATRGGFGFGDVRFAPLVGAATATVSWTLLAWALVLGSLVGAAVGTGRLLTRRSGSFAYAPSILAGAYLAAIASWLTT